MDILQASLVLTLHSLKQSHSTRSLIQVGGQGREACLHALQTLHHKDCIHYNAPHDHWQATQGSPRKSPLIRAHAEATALLSNTSHCPPYAKAVLLLENGKLLDGCDILLEVIRSAVRAGHSALATTCLTLLIFHISHWNAEPQADADIRRYVSLIRCIQGISMYLSKRVEESLELLPKARQAAQRLGDKRVLLMLDLTEASQRHLAQAHNTEPPRSLLARTLKNIQNLGDTDIQASTSHAIGILHYMQAEYHDAIAYLSVGSTADFTTHFDYFEESRWRYVAGAACSLGKNALALGVMYSALQEARLAQNKLTVRWRQVHLADALLRMGIPEEALPHLDEVLACADPEAETRLWNWGVRCLAYYHFQHGNTALSHSTLHGSMMLSALYGLQRPYYGFTWLFDMLWEFHAQGLPPIPGYDLEYELSAALHGPNKQFQAAALRIRALQLEKQGASPQAIAELARLSQQHALSVGNPLEEARSSLILTRCLRAQGEDAEAAILYDTARATLAHYTQYDCPPPRQESNAPCNTPYVPEAEHCLRKLHQGLESLPVWETLAEHMQCLLRLVRDALEVEGVSLFRKSGEHELTCLGSCNLSQLEIHSSLFAERYHWLVTQASETVPAHRHDHQGVALCLPLTISGQQPLALFLHCRYLTERLTAQDNSLFTQVAHTLTMELRTAFLLEKHMQESQRKAEEKARMAAARMDNVDMPHYGTSMRTSLQQADHVAQTDASVLILGETGVGKEMLARRIHAHSGRTGPFVPVHPASTPETLFESEFFGHEKGAFTGAHRQKVGLFELADKGTLFIDELGEIPLTMQTKLLRVLQEKTFLRVGGTREIHSDFRLVCATNRNLTHMTQAGSFREDLYYRVAVMPLHLPPLRERPEDITHLAQHFLELFARRYQRHVPALTPEDLAVLRTYPWPGNIRELKSVMERSVILHSGIKLHLALSPGQPAALPSADSPTPALELAHDLPSMEELQARYIQKILHLTRGKIDGPQGAARILGMKRSTLYAKIRKYGLDAASLAYGPRPAPAESHPNEKAAPLTGDGPKCQEVS